MSQATATNTEEKGFNLSAWALANQQLVGHFFCWWSWFVVSTVMNDSTAE